jgi:hypothetical protein
VEIIDCVDAAESESWLAANHRATNRYLVNLRMLKARSAAGQVAQLAGLVTLPRRPSDHLRDALYVPGGQS